MPITDNRTLLDAANAVTNWVDESGATMDLSANTDVFVQGTASIGIRTAASQRGILYNAGSAQDWSSNVFYIWWQTTNPANTTTKATGGITVRFTGATVTDWFEVYIAGSDTYSGGWVMSVVDIEEARRLAVDSPPNGGTNGTTPETTAIQRVGIVWDIPGMIIGTDDNCYVDAIWRLPIGTPGIIVDGRNTTVSPEIPWTWQDIVDAADVQDATKAWGSITQNDGVIKINTPVQFGVEGPVPSPEPIHEFVDTNKVIAWESQLVINGFYGFKIVGPGFGTQRFEAGVTDGNTGSQGWVVTAEQPDGPRWFVDASSILLDQVGFYGCTFLHSTVIDIDNLAVEMLNTLLVDGQRLWHSRL